MLVPMSTCLPTHGPHLHAPHPQLPTSVRNPTIHLPALLRGKLFKAGHTRTPQLGPRAPLTPLYCVSLRDFSHPSYGACVRCCHGQEVAASGRDTCFAAIGGNSSRDFGAVAALALPESGLGPRAAVQYWKCMAHHQARRWGQRKPPGMARR